MSLTDAELLPCPFCGKPPETQGSGEGQRGLMIDCITPNCVNPHVSYYDHKSAISAWNRRVSTHPSNGVVTEEMVKAAARAICVANGEDPDKEYPYVDPDSNVLCSFGAYQPQWFQVMPLARAALQAALSPEQKAPETLTLESGLAEALARRQAWKGPE